MTATTVDTAAGVPQPVPAPEPAPRSKSSKRKPTKKTEQLPRRKITWNIVWAQRALIAMAVPLLLYQILFKYVPAYGWAMAFQHYRPGRGSIWNQQWVGFENFRNLFTGLNGERFREVVINTLGQSILTLVVGTLGAIVLALLLNEVKNLPFKRVLQNITYMPHFLSWVVVASLAAVALSLPSSGGFINQLLLSLGIVDEPVMFLTQPNYFWGIVAGTSLWKELGWNTILYLAAITAISPALYEAAEVDGAGRYRKMWSITLPGIMPTIVVLLIINSGWILSTNFELPYFLGNGLVSERAETIDVFVLRYGYQLGNYSLAVVAGIFKTVVAIILVGSANLAAKRLNQETLV
ncbi:sugar ABC transporter permease [Microbacterium sp. NEAU-LLC]|uniref:Sugar ABC transporter permease n=1 Tax=Microbacterium helvum TaxID=2773713 RepID=A0ABR8NUT7_9MICO|nr:ABC transporter permease subunit [Microbacterium helvum]MBD3943507.1 sugar ABC transporter permease [Microbacterium helvum]